MAKKNGISFLRISLTDRVYYTTSRFFDQMAFEVSGFIQFEGAKYFSFPENNQVASPSRNILKKLPMTVAVQDPFFGKGSSAFVNIPKTAMDNRDAPCLTSPSHGFGDAVFALVFLAVLYYSF
jgi:hypothetical protein